MAIEVHNTVYGESGLEFWSRLLHSTCLPEYCATARDIRMRRTLRRNIERTYRDSDAPAIIADVIARSGIGQRAIDGLRLGGGDLRHAPVAQEDAEDYQIRRLSTYFESRGGLIDGRAYLFVFDEIDPKRSYIITEEI